MSSTLQLLAPDLWVRHYPLKVLGTDHGRTVTLIRLASGRTILHSMAPFTPEDIAEIRTLGEPGWLVEAMLLHDTYAKEGRALFPDLPFLAPEGFSEVEKFPTLPLGTVPPEWQGEVDVIEVRGAPRLREMVMVHRASRTLIVADLIFNFRSDEQGWNRFFHRWIAGFRRYPGMSRVFRAFISDRPAFEASLQEILTADFDRIIVGHGEVIETNGKALLRRAMQDAGFLKEG
jgi:hypothetical protein